MDGRALAPVTLSVPDGVSYDGHSAKALLELAQGRGLEGVTSRTAKPQLIAALTEADRVRASGFVDGADGADVSNDPTRRTDPWARRSSSPSARSSAATSRCWCCRPSPSHRGEAGDRDRGHRHPNLTMLLYKGAGFNPAGETATGEAPLRLGESKAREEAGDTTFSIPEIQYTHDPQGDDTVPANIARATLLENDVCTSSSDSAPARRRGLLRRHAALPPAPRPPRPADLGRTGDTPQTSSASTSALLRDAPPSPASSLPERHPRPGGGAAGQDAPSPAPPATCPHPCPRSTP